jgi:peptide/nickel transport system permease protein
MAEIQVATPTTRSVPRQGGRWINTIPIALSLLVISVVVAFAVLGELIAPRNPNQQNLFIGAVAPNDEFLLGTDQIGRDILSRIIAGARTALVGPMLVAVGGMTIGTMLGMLGGYIGGRLDALIMRWVDLMYSLPALLIAIVVIGVIGGGYVMAVLVLIILFSPADTRIVRAEALRQRPLPYIEAALTLGVPTWRIMFVHVFPNVLPVVVSYVFLDFAFGLVSLSGLSFLGLGVPPGTPDWGRMLFENRTVLFVNPLAAIAPGLMIVAAAASMNILGDWLYERFASSGAGR